MAGLGLKLLTLWLIYSLNPRSSKQKLHVDMTSEMIIARNEKHISEEKLFPAPGWAFMFNICYNTWSVHIIIIYSTEQSVREREALVEVKIQQDECNDPEKNVSMQ